MPPQQTAAAPLCATDQIVALARELRDLDTVALDTEFNRTNTYRPELCLLQAGTKNLVALVDMLADADFSPVLDWIAGSPGLKVFHAAKQDMEALHSNFGTLPNRLLDTQIAAGLLGHPPQVGYGSLVAEVLGVELEKAATRTDWAKRPLTDRQLDYAREDVTYLLELFHRLEQQLEASGRYRWALEDSELLLDPALYASCPDDAWQRLGGLAYLPVPVQARARELAAWRETRAQQLNRPRQWVLSDKALLNLATENPANGTALSRVAELPPAVARRQGEQLLQALARGNDRTSGDSETLQRARRPTPTDQSALKKLSRLVRDHAGQLGIAPEILATRRELTGLLRGEVEQRVTTGWRREVIGDRLLAAV